MRCMLNVLECLREERPQYVDLAVNTCFSFHPVVFTQSNFTDYKFHCIRKLMEVHKVAFPVGNDFHLTLLWSRMCHFLIVTRKMHSYQTFPGKIEWNHYLKRQVKGAFFPSIVPEQRPPRPPPRPPMSRELSAPLISSTLELRIYFLLLSLTRDSLSSVLPENSVLAPQVPTPLARSNHTSSH